MGSETERRNPSAEHQAVTNFRRYLRIKTVQPEPDYDGAIKFLKEMAGELGLPYKVIEVSPGNPVFVMTVEGKDPSLPSLMLNSHIDVVPVDMDCWKVDPFSAEKMENGDIYARGSQDMKCVGIQYIEAIRQLLKDGKKMLRNVHLTFMPDEEVGGKLGMQLFIKREEFKQMNIAFALDEGLANPTEHFTIFYGERSAWWAKIKCPGNPGHGSRFIENTAAEKFRNIINKLLSLRDEEEKRLKSNPNLVLGDVTSVNLTMVEGGLQHNVVPSRFTVCFDIRVPPSVDPVQFEEKLNNLCKEAGEGLTLEYVQKGCDNKLTSIDDGNIWWKTFSSTFENMNLKIKTEIFPAGTDIRYLRELGYPALGFSPMNFTPILLHDHNEFLNENIFLKGIDIYYNLISNLANVK
ncbi:aminoacylase-1 isoform X1 [Octopus bimaculoides]|uniref:N-acyl-aliphatic-L-amino acid amidohydrolase n=2 Tax=Octopus bimaculoides TaxID=37653 RepID=A0A0L8GC35_OCTBM|nr:aminoacylase-1 isoform X1 [Octopus bimaculoides]|eukprot:XP_014782659.1 PREDICTED: aminoacylase-1-like [Octopus bimaculoides]